MTHGSLFSGLGLFDLAAEWMGWDNVFHCEIDPFLRDHLKDKWPMADSYGDITKTYFSKYRGKIDVLTGGFPCQPFSVAGTRSGTDDVRFLWPEMLRAIREIKPCWVVAENVYGLLNIDNGYTADMVCSDLENCGYEKPVILDCQANQFGLPTMERHIWFISKAVSLRCQRGKEIPDENIRNERIFQGTNSRGSERRDISKTKFRFVGERIARKLDKVGRQYVKAIGNGIPPQVAYQIFKTIDISNGIQR